MVQGIGEYYELGTNITGGVSERLRWENKLQPGTLFHRAFDPSPLQINVRGLNWLNAFGVQIPVPTTAVLLVGNGEWFVYINYLGTILVSTTRPRGNIFFCGRVLVAGGVITEIHNHMEVLTRETIHPIYKIPVGDGAPYSADSQPSNWDEVIVFAATETGATYSLPTASAFPGRAIFILSTGEPVTLDPPGTNTIEGLSTFVIAAETGVRIISDGVDNWYVVAEKGTPTVPVGGLTQRKSANFNAIVGVTYLVDSTLGPIIVTLQGIGAPTEGKSLRIVDEKGTSLTNNIVINTTAPDTVVGGTQIIINTNYSSVELVASYNNGVNKKWGPS